MRPSIGKRGRLIFAGIDALLPLLGILCFGWSAVAYVIWFLADCVLVPAGAVARRVQFQLHGFDPGPEANWVDHASLWLAPVLTLGLFALVMGAGLAAFLVPLILFSNWWPAIVAAWHSELFFAIVSSLVLQTFATLRPSQPLKSIEAAFAQEHQSALPLALALIVMPGAIAAGAALGQSGLMIVATVASALRLVLAWYQESRAPSDESAPPRRR